MRLRTAFAAVSIAALSAACAQEAEAPPEPVEPSPAPAAPAAPPISYACESGQSVTVAYPDTATAQLTYQGRAWTLRAVQAASGARYAGADLEWSTVTRDGLESAALSRLGPSGDVGVAVLERCSRPSAGAVPAGPVPPPEAGVLP
ncbi:MliC family protein, partial [uncultured Brevundimonas sp.]|uniref:MliC family protein n=1 Tax=uncultured Brevundimonas sp. TaxID=213418 RepID=UPI002623F347